MKGRRLAALLCVLLMHAAAVIPLLDWRGAPPGAEGPVFEPAAISLWPRELPEDETATESTVALSPTPYSLREPRLDAPGGEGETASATDTSAVDWPLEGKKAAARVLEREAEAERIAKMFAGPGGTWKSLTKRERSRLSKFRFRPGLAGFECDSQGNQIYRLSEGCAVINGSYIACTVGKQKVHGDMFENLREYFDEQRLPETDEGNGTEYQPGCERR